MSGEEATRELGDKHGRDGEFERFESGLRARTCLVDHESEGDEHDGQGAHAKLPGDVVPGDERAIAVTQRY